jgi:AraC-like DNA-binding protein
MAESLDKDQSAYFENLKNAVFHAVVVDPNRSAASGLDNFSIKQVPFAKLGVYDLEIDPMTVHRGQEDIIRDSVDDYFLTTQLEGMAVIKQGKTEFTLKPGELAIIAGGLPYSITYTEHSRRLILRIPNHVLHERLLSKDDHHFNARVLSSSGLVPIVIDLLKSLTLEAEQLTETEQYTLAESFLELTAAVLRSSADQEVEKNAKQSALLRRILMFMEKHYMDCDLTPEKVAQANGISMRYLHSLFQQSGMTVCKWIWERRLKATREDLLDPAMEKNRISEIAFRRGFNDPAHFSRAFKERFGLSPSQLRSKATGAAATSPDEA